MTNQLERLKTALADRYAIERELGAGGMATVYLAEDLKHHRKVAVKVLRPDLAAALGPERFLQEIEIAAQLQHPNILALYDSGEADGFLFYVMPYIEGSSLRDKLAKEGELPIGDAVRILRDVVDALTEAHAHGVVHRDIKPENILLRGRHALVSDFGVAKAVSEATGREQLTTAGVALGTPAYMAPEQASADPHLDQRVDIYAVGAVAYELLTGRPVFMGTTPQMVLSAHMTEPPQPITKHRDTVPAALESVVMRCLEKRPADRWQSAEELLPQFEALATPSGGVTPTGSTPVKTVLTRPKRALAAALAVTAATVVLAAVIGVLMWPKAQRAESTGVPLASTAIAVLPFQNLTAEESRAYFASGLHDELLTQLAKVAALKVINRTSVLGYAGTTKPLANIAQELAVGSIVEGSVQVEGNRLRVNVLLIDATTGANLWAEQYNRTLDDAFATQSEIAERIVTVVGATLTDAEANAIATTPTDNAEAYRLYLQGEEYRQRVGNLQRNVEIAQQLFERALELDPEFALAYASLSRVHGVMYWWGYDPYPSRAESQRAAAELAVQLAPDLPQAHWAMGWAHYWGERDYTKALGEFTSALEGLPGSAELWVAVSAVHRRLGNWDQTLAAYERATALDPRHVEVLHDWGGNTFRFLHRYEEAIPLLNRALELAPDYAVAQLNKGLIYMRWRGELDSLRNVLEQGPEAYGFLGTRDLWRSRLALLERKPEVVLGLLGGAPEHVTFEAQDAYEPGLLHAAWAFQLSGDRVAAAQAFTGALVQLDSALRELPDDWRPHASRGLALAGLGRQLEAKREADWLTTSIVYADVFTRPTMQRARAMIFAQAGLVDEALAEIEPLLAGPSSYTSVPTARLDPRWDPIRDDPRFQTLLDKYKP